MKAKRILSLDGGGIRGLVTCRWLAGAEDALLAAGKPGLMKSFDLYAGSSTGAIVATYGMLSTMPDSTPEVNQRDSNAATNGTTSSGAARAIII